MSVMLLYRRSLRSLSRLKAMVSCGFGGWFLDIAVFTGCLHGVFWFGFVRAHARVDLGGFKRVGVVDGLIGFC